MGGRGTLLWFEFSVFYYLGDDYYRSREAGQEERVFCGGRVNELVVGFQVFGEGWDFAGLFFSCFVLGRGGSGIYFLVVTVIGQLLFLGDFNFLVLLGCNVRIQWVLVVREGFRVEFRCWYSGVELQVLKCLGYRGRGQGRDRICYK